MRKLVLPMLAVALAGCGDLLKVEAEAEEVCVRQLGQTLPGTGAASPVSIPGSIAKEFPLDLADISELEDQDVDARLDLTSFRLAAPAGALAGLERLSVSINPPTGSALPPLTLVELPSSDPDAAIRVDGDTVTVNLAAAKRDLLGYLESGEVSVKLEADGTLPVAEWQADLEVCAAADATYRYGL